MSWAGTIREEDGVEVNSNLQLNDERNLNNLRRVAVNSIESFKPAHQETDGQLNNRLMKEFQDLGTLTAIPYEYIGADLSSIYSDGNVPSYPDYYKLTPVYNMKFSGKSFGGHLSSLFNTNSGNFVGKRLMRWWNEDKVVTYCDRINKLASITSFFVLLMTFAITVWQLIVGAQLTYKATRKNEDDVKQLDDFANSLPWTIFKAIVSGFSAAVVMWNVYKRTTLPKRGIKINKFNNGGEIEFEKVKRRTMAGIPSLPVNPIGNVLQWKSKATSSQVAPVQQLDDFSNIYNGRT